MPARFPTQPQPLRRDLVDARSTGAPAARGGKPLLTDRRSTRGRRS